jgi:hypothetical protein
MQNMPNIISARIDKIFACSFLLFSMVVSACTAQPSEKALASPVQPQAKTGDKMTTTNPMEIATQKALADASRRTGVDVSALKVVSAERVTWSDGSMGCPAPGMAYTQALVDGYRIRIQAGKELLHYHGGAEPKFCPADRVQDALPNDKT